MAIYKCQTEQHNKWWEYQINGLTVTYRWSRIGATKIDSTVKTFSSSAAMHAHIAAKVREKEGKGYVLSDAEDLANEFKTAQALGVENKIQRLLWVDRKGKRLNKINAYDPDRYIFVEILNSWSKAVTRLLLSRTQSWVLEGSITEMGQTIAIGDINPVHGKAIQFAQAVRQKLKEMAEVVTSVFKTVKVAALGARNLFDDNDQPTVAIDMTQFTNKGMNTQLVSKFAALGTRALEL